MKETVAVGIPNYGNSVILYVAELLPGNYELELQYGWLNNVKPQDFTTAEELIDVNIEIYSLYQDSEASKLLHHKDRHIKEMESMVRDMSIVNFIGRSMGDYLSDELRVPTHPPTKDAALSIPFKITADYAQVLVIANQNFTYIDSIQVLRKDSNSMIKRIHADTESSLSEVLPQGEYILQFTYKDDSNREHDPTLQSITFGINYENMKKYKSCNQKLINMWSNSKLGETVIMLKAKDGVLVLDLEVAKPELLSVQLHYNLFLTQKPLKLYVDKLTKQISNESMKHMMLSPGNHTLTIVGPDSSLDETCILASLIEYEVPLADMEISTMPGIILKPGVQSIVISSIEKGTTNLPLPSFKQNTNDTLFSSTLLIHFDPGFNAARTSNVVELDMNFDTEEVLDFKSQLYYESTKDKMISFIDIADTKPAALVDKQFEVTHTTDLKSGKYVAHFVVFNGDQIASKFDSCNAEKKAGKLQSLGQDASFYYNDYGKEDFGLAIDTAALAPGSKFYDSESDLFFFEIIYEVRGPAFIEVAVEYDISMSNVDLFIFQDFKDEVTIEDQELAGSTLTIPSMIESTVSRHTSIYVVQAGKYSVFVIDKKLPFVFKQMTKFEGESPCAKLRVTHSIQEFSPAKLVESSIAFLSVWPRRLEIGDPYFVNSKRNLEVVVYPNTLVLDRKNPPKIKFAVIDMNSNKVLYNIDPDKVSVSVPVRKVQQKDGLQKMVKEIEIRCFFKSNTLSNVIGGGRLLTIADQDKISDKSMTPYYVIVDGEDPDLENVDIKPNRTSSTRQVKEKLSLKQQRKDITKNINKLDQCYKS